MGTTVGRWPMHLKPGAAEINRRVAASRRMDSRAFGATRIGDAASVGCGDVRPVGAAVWPPPRRQASLTIMPAIGPPRRRGERSNRGAATEGGRDVRTAGGNSGDRGGDRPAGSG